MMSDGETPRRLKFAGAREAEAPARALQLDSPASIRYHHAIMAPTLTLHLEGPSADDALLELLATDGLTAAALPQEDGPRRVNPVARLDRERKPRPTYVSRN